MFVLVRTDSGSSKHARHHLHALRHGHARRERAADQAHQRCSPFCETFLEDVRVPKDQVVGGVNNGWTMAKALLGHERSMISEAFSESRDAQPAGGAARDARRRGSTAACATPSLRDRIAQLTMDKICLDLTLARTKEARSSAISPGRSRRSSSTTRPS